MIYVSRIKKLAGILIERKVGQDKNNFVVGVGMNVAMSLNNEVSVDTPWIDFTFYQAGLAHIKKRIGGAGYFCILWSIVKAWK